MQPGLTLYAFQSCPYCRRVFEALEALDLEIEVKDIHLESENRKELVEATGRGTVPVLRIEEDGVVRWLPQSREIVAYLYTRFGEGKTPPRTMASLDGYIRMGMWGLLLAGAVLGLLADDARRQQMGAAGRAYAETAFDLDAVAERVEAVLRDAEGRR